MFFCVFLALDNTDQCIHLGTRPAHHQLAFASGRAPVSFPGDAYQMHLTGDYNARTGVLDDFITIENAVAECTGINVNVEGLYQSKHNLSDKGIEVRRFNEDKLVNNNGRLLLDFCKGLDLHIVNLWESGK